MPSMYVGDYVENFNQSEHMSTTQANDLDRKQTSILIVEPELSIKGSLRQSLLSLGFCNITESISHGQALEKLEETKFNCIIFEAKATNMDSREFIRRVMEANENVFAIASSWEPSIDDVFGLLSSGARGILVKPFTHASLEEALKMASKTSSFSEALMYAHNRNEALASVILSALDKLAITLKEARQFQTAKWELPKRMLTFRRAIETGQNFAENGAVGLLESIVDLCQAKGEEASKKVSRSKRRAEERRREAP